MTNPLICKNGLHYIKIRKPTKDELNDYTIYDLTSGVPWYPRFYENDNSDDDDDATKRRLIESKFTKPAEPDWVHLQRFLECKSIDNVKRTFPATTQSAQSTV